MIITSIANLVLLKNTDVKNRLQLCNVILDDIRCLYPTNITLYNNISHIKSFYIDKSRQNFIINTLSDDYDHYDVYIINNDNNWDVTKYMSFNFITNNNNNWHVTKYMSFKFIINVALYNTNPLGIIYSDDIISQTLEYFNGSINYTLYNFTNMITYAYDLYDDYYYVYIHRKGILKININNGDTNMIDIDHNINYMLYNPSNELMYVVASFMINSIDLVTGDMHYLTTMRYVGIKSCGWNDDNTILYCSIYDDKDIEHNTLMSYNIKTYEINYITYPFNIHGIYST